MMALNIANQTCLLQSSEYLEPSEHFLQLIAKDETHSHGIESMAKSSL